MLNLVIQGEPLPLPRPRVVRVHGRSRTYLEPRAAAHQKMLAFHLLCEKGLRAHGAFPMKGPVTVRLQFFRSTSRRCDLDNLVKMVLDALTLARVWDDDCQVEMLVASKHRGSPRTWISVEPCSEAEASSYRPGADPILGERLRPMHAGQDRSGSDGT